MQARLKGQQEMKQDWNTIFNWYFLMEKANSLVSLPLQFNLVQEESDSHHMLLPFLVNRAKKPSDALKIETFWLQILSHRKQWRWFQSQTS